MWKKLTHTHRIPYAATFNWFQHWSRGKASSVPPPFHVSSFPLYPNSLWIDRKGILRTTGITNNIIHTILCYNSKTTQKLYHKNWMQKVTGLWNRVCVCVCGVPDIDQNVDCTDHSIQHVADKIALEIFWHRLISGCEFWFVCMRIRRKPNDSEMRRKTLSIDIITEHEVFMRSLHCI